MTGKIVDSAPSAVDSTVFIPSQLTRTIFKVHLFCYYRILVVVKTFLILFSLYPKLVLFEIVLLIPRLWLF